MVTIFLLDGNTIRQYFTKNPLQCVLMLAQYDRCDIAPYILQLSTLNLDVFRIAKYKSLSKPQQASLLPSDTIPIRPLSHLIKALGFTVGVGTVAFTAAVISDCERQSLQHRLFFSTEFLAASGLMKPNPSGTKDFRLWWSQLTDGDKCAFYLVGVNLAVFLLWKVKGLNGIMWRYFSNSFASKSLCVPMALSVFSHYSAVHLALNMYVVLSFTSVAVNNFLGPDQFWAVFLTAGVMSSFSGIAHKAVLRSPIRAVGASGAILGMLGYTCMKIPEARLKILFVPGFDFSARSAIIGVLLFDIAGLLLRFFSEVIVCMVSVSFSYNFSNIIRFRMFDHAAHIGGTLFGVFYALVGQDLIWNRFGRRVEHAYGHLRRQ
ncbi:hypothetical protein KIN20_024356 [Parelaphostrongylus tenuis]|uniref:rhomboid protease n=1 Tax=Parelaphostrongylus tenuis TaxID=148309 RepID=A0AAD5MY64_PARTN|nr:hypothetical protein KIN20_024356 [Parelaphostrongylus tenuis]